MATGTGSPLYERIGEQEAIDRIVDDFYGRVTADPDLQHYFAHAPMERLKAMQKEFFAVALGGPVTYSGMALSEVHGRLGINRTAFSRFAGHLVETLDDQGYDDELVRAVVDRISLYADDVVGGQGEGG